MQPDSIVRDRTEKRRGNFEMNHSLLFLPIQKIDIFA
jgi:hypothetical protein